MASELGDELMTTNKVRAESVVPSQGLVSSSPKTRMQLAQVYAILALVDAVESLDRAYRRTHQLQNFDD